jgi:hypothetical protein
MGGMIMAIPYQNTGMLLLASNGGRGSYSFADTSVFGDRGLRVTSPEAMNLSIPQAVVPGGGGGAKANRQMPYGSRAIGYNPNGIVLIRLTRVE